MSDKLKAWIHWKKKEGLSEDDTLLISDIESLQKENATLETKVKELEEELKLTEDIVLKYQSEIMPIEKDYKELKQAILRMAEGIEFYGEENNFDVNEYDDDFEWKSRIVDTIQTGSYIEEYKSHGKLAREIQKETASVVEKLRGEE